MAARIKALRVKKYGLRGRAAFARDVDVTGNTVKFWEEGGMPKGEVLQKIAEVFDVSVRLLVRGEEDPRDAALRVHREGRADPAKREKRLDDLDEILNDLVPELEARRAAGRKDLPGVRIVSIREIPKGLKASEFYALPLLDDAVAAGTPREIEDAHVEGVCVIHRHWCPNPRESVFVRVKGDSMEPTIPEGAFVCIDAAVHDVAEMLGRVVVIVVEGFGATIKRLQRTERGELVGIPDHLTPDNRPINIKEGDRIVGLVRSVHAEVK